MSNPVYIIGAGGHAKQVVDAFELAGYTIQGVFDDRIGSPLFLGYPVLGPISLIEALPRSTRLHCAIGDNRTRADIFDRFRHYDWVNCVHPQASVSARATMGVGNYVGGGARVLAAARVGNCNILNELSVVAHDCVVGDCNHVSIFAVLLGRSRIGDLNLIGGSATMLPDAVLGNRNVLGAGGLLLKAWGDDGTLVGVPARPKIHRHSLSASGATCRA